MFELSNISTSGGDRLIAMTSWADVTEWFKQSFPISYGCRDKKGQREPIGTNAQNDNFFYFKSDLYAYFLL